MGWGNKFWLELSRGLEDQDFTDTVLVITYF